MAPIYIASSDELQFLNVLIDTCHCPFRYSHLGGGGLVTKSYPTLHDPVNYSPPGSSVHGISQARTQQWVAISSPIAILVGVKWYLIVV